MPRNKPLPPDLVSRFFKEDLPARVAALASYPRHNDVVDGSRLPEPAKRQVLAAISYSNAVAGRMLLEFLGIGYDAWKEELYEKDINAQSGRAAYREHDVHVQELGGTLVRLVDIDVADQDVLRIFLHMANRVAHLTYDFRMEDEGRPDGYEYMRPATAIIERLLDKHLYQPTGMRRLELGT